MFLNLETLSYSCSNEVDEDKYLGNSERNSETHWTVSGITLSEEDGGQFSLPCDFNVTVGDMVYVVYAVYSTGDSFGHDSGAYLEVLSFNRDGERAERNKAAAEGGHISGTLTIEFDAGGMVERGCPWDGYFESLDYVRCEAYALS